MSVQLVFGLDLGMNNVGWAAIKRDDDSVVILKAGTYVFQSPLADINDPSSGLKSRDRGIKIRQRRSLRRKVNRKRTLTRLLESSGFLPFGFEARTAFFCQHKVNGEDVHPYALRAKALKHPLAAFELGRVFCHFNQRRGFLSPRDLMLLGVANHELESRDADEETGVILKEVKQTRAAMEGFRTIGEFLNDRLKNGLPVRKKTLKSKDEKVLKITPAMQKAEDVRRFVRADRKMIDKEFWEIVNVQRLHHPLLTEELANSIYDTIFYQRELSADESTRGTCTFFNDELRIPRGSLTAQRFVILQELVNLRVFDGIHTDERALTQDEIKILLELLMLGEDLSWTQIKNALNLNSSAQFNVEPVKKKGASKAGTKDHLRGSQTVSRLLDILGDKWHQLGDAAQRDLVGEIISIRDWTSKYKGKAKVPTTGNRKPAAGRRYELFSEKSYGPNGVTFTPKEAAELATVTLPPGYLNLSLRAIKKVMPKMLQGMTYDAACAAVGINHSVPVVKGEVRSKLDYPTDDDIRHPLVLASVRSAVKFLTRFGGSMGNRTRFILNCQGTLQNRRRNGKKPRKPNERMRRSGFGFTKNWWPTSCLRQMRTLRKFVCGESAGRSCPTNRTL